jgi:hypothetical protein
MLKACEHLRWTAAYVNRHNVPQFQREASMAQEMAKLIGEKIELVQRIKKPDAAK